MQASRSRVTDVNCLVETRECRRPNLASPISQEILGLFCVRNFPTATYITPICGVWWARLSERMSALRLRCRTTNQFSGDSGLQFISNCTPGASIPRQPWRNPLFLLPLSAPSPVLTWIRGYHPRENVWMKDACRRVLEHIRHKHQHV